MRARERQLGMEKRTSVNPITSRKCDNNPRDVKVVWNSCFQNNQDCRWLPLRVSRVLIRFKPKCGMGSSLSRWQATCVLPIQGHLLFTTPTTHLFLPIYIHILSFALFLQCNSRVLSNADVAQGTSEQRRDPLGSSTSARHHVGQHHPRRTLRPHQHCGGLLSWSLPQEASVQVFRMFLPPVCHL